MPAGHVIELGVELLQKHQRPLHVLFVENALDDVQR